MGVDDSGIQSGQSNLFVVALKDGILFQDSAQKTQGLRSQNNR